MTAAPPLVFAHRGGAAAFPEHSHEAYRRAIALGVDGLECDVRLTQDGHLVCVHDATVERTSTGQGRVSRLSLAELNELDWTSWHAVNRPRSEGVLTLDALLTLALGAGRPLRLLVETKHPARFGGAVEQRLVEVLRTHGLHTRAGGRDQGVSVTVMSFSPLALRRVRVLAPDLPTVFLFEYAAPSVWRGRAPAGADALGPGISAVRRRPELVRRAHDRGAPVFVWTVNEAADIELTTGLGVDGIISDRPRDVLVRLDRTV